MEQWLDEPNKVYESAGLSEQSQVIANFLKNTDLSKIYEFYIDCMNIDHVDFVIKSHYMLGQISTVLSHVKIGDAYFGVDGDSILWECLFVQAGNEFKLSKITNDGYVAVEQAVIGKVNEDSSSDIFAEAHKLLKERAQKGGSYSDVVYFHKPLDFEVNGYKLSLYSAQSKGDDFEVGFSVVGKRIMYYYATYFIEPKVQQNKLGFDELHYEPMTEEVAKLLIENLK